MIFTYSKTVAIGYCEATDEYDEEDVEFEYEVDEERIEEAIVNIVYNECFSECEDTVKKGIYDLINSYDLWDKFKEILEDELHDYFESEAKYE